MTRNDYVSQQRELATAWKKRTPTLDPGARAASPWINQGGSLVGDHPFCLPVEHAAQNLLPSSQQAIELFRELDIPWHCGIDGGPGNHLLSSQVQCANALMPMVNDPQRIARAFGGVLDVAEVLEIESGRYLTFEYIGPADYFGEGAGKPRRRGTRCTSVDAAFRYRTSGGVIELALVEWKYTEEYTRKRTAKPSSDATRIDRYGASYSDPDGPLDSDLLDITFMLDEPFYQLMRQQLLAWRLERERAEGAEIVRVVHVLPPQNSVYQRSLVREEHRALGKTVDEVWQRLLRHSDRFVHLDPGVFLDQDVTSWDYVDRYSPTGTGDLPPGVCVWRDEGDAIAAAAFMNANGLEWCHRSTSGLDVPRNPRDAASLPRREHLLVFDDEKTMLTGPLEHARAFLRAIVTTGVTRPCHLVTSSWPAQVTEHIATWPPVDLRDRLPPPGP